MADSLVFIPAWNEEASLPTVLSELREELPDADVLVVDDGSTDGTLDWVRAAGRQWRGLRLLHDPTNQRKSATSPKRAR